MRNRQNFSSFRLFTVTFQPFSNRNLQIFPWKPNWIRVQSLLNVCWHSDTKTIQKVHKLHKNKVEIFRLLWSHSEVFVKQNTVMISSRKHCIARFFVVEWIAELRTKSFEKTEYASKTTKTSKFWHRWKGQFEDLFFYELNLSRNDNSPKQKICPRPKRLNTIVHGVYRFVDKKWRKKRNLIIFRNFVFFDVDSKQFPIEKLHLSLF